MSAEYPATLEAWGYSPGWHARFLEAAVAGSLPGRVIRDHRGYLRVRTTTGERIATLAGRLKHQAQQATELPAVGDFVVVREAHETGHEIGRGVIHKVLPRLTAFRRKAAGHQTEEQVVAANIDTVFVVCGLDSDYSPRRVERYLILARESGARAVVLLNKADKNERADAALAEVTALAGNVPVHLIAAKPRIGLDALAPYLTPRATLAFLGSSGAGKSTLINRLLGEERQATQEVREIDSKGRHTTTERQMFQLAGGALAIDTPGMRELQLWTRPEEIAGGFADIEALAGDCRFRDCTHEREPACAVRHAVESGALLAERWEHYLKLRGEASAVAAQREVKTRLEKKAADKMIARAVKKHAPRR